MRYYGVGKKLLVKRILPEKKQSALIMPDEPLPRWLEVEVDYVGCSLDSDGCSLDCGWMIGEKIIISSHAGSEFFDGLWLIDEKDIVAIKIRSVCE